MASGKTKKKQVALKPSRIASATVLHHRAVCDSSLWRGAAIGVLLALQDPVLNQGQNGSTHGVPFQFVLCTSTTVHNSFLLTGTKRGKEGRESRRSKVESSVIHVQVREKDEDYKKEEEGSAAKREDNRFYNKTILTRRVSGSKRTKKNRSSCENSRRDLFEKGCKIHRDKKEDKEVAQEEY